MTERPTSPQLHHVAATATAELLRRLSGVETLELLPYRRFEWPTIVPGPRGFPLFYIAPDIAAPVNYGHVLQLERLVEDNESLAAFDSYCSTDSRLEAYLAVPTGSRVGLMRNFLGQLLEGYVHRHGLEFDDNHFLRVYLPLEHYYYRDELTCDIWVPLVGLDCTSAKKLGNLTPEVSLAVMSESFQEDRAASLAGKTVDRQLAGFATHALHFAGWSFRNDNYWVTRELLRSYSNVPLHWADQFLAAVRTSLDLRTGYCQVVYEPREWVTQYVAGRPGLESTVTRRYPVDFASFNPSEQAVAQLDDGADLLRLYGSLRVNWNENLGLACRRLNSCYLRDNEEDALVDASIGLEALLLDGQGEMTYKIALRSGALGRLVGEDAETRVEAARQTRAMYGKRSRIVHGAAANLQERRTLLGREVWRDQAVSDGVGLLRRAIYILAAHPEYSDPTRIDEDLLLGDRYHEHG